MSASFDRMATVTASTQRPAANGTGMQVHLTGLAALPLMPVSPETIERMGLNSPREQKETFVASQTHVDGGVEVNQLPDIKQGDWWVVAGLNYPVQAVGEWTDGVHDYLDVIVDEKRKQ